MVPPTKVPPPVPSRNRRIKVGISACLLGQEVRYDGGHKRDPFLVETLGRYVEWVPVCPEVEAGFGTPREAMRLVDAGPVGETLRLVTIRSGVDLTDSLGRWAVRRVEELEGADLCGYVLKKDSPSCGLERVKVYGPDGTPARRGRGLFASALVARFPNLPVEDEGRLSDARRRESFVERVIGYRRLRDLFEGRWTTGRLVAFQAAHKLQILSHSEKAYRELGRLVAAAAGTPRDRLRATFEAGFMAALRLPATPRRHANVLYHMAGYLKQCLDAASRAELVDAIERYRQGLLPLAVPVSLMRRHVRRCGVEYLAGQTYLAAHWSLVLGH